MRELHQITCMKYNIGIASEAQTPSGMKGKRVFILESKEKAWGPLPLVPRINANVVEAEAVLARPSEGSVSLVAVVSCQFSVVGCQ